MFLHGVASFRGISTPSLTAQGEQRRSSFFNNDRDIPGPDHEKAMSDILHELVCVRDVNAIFILRGLLRDSNHGFSQIAAAGDEAPALIELILNGNQNGECPVSAQLTFEDKLQLSKQKEELEKQKRKKSDEVMLQHSSEPEIPPEPQISPPPVDEFLGTEAEKPEYAK
ncbi:MAG: hypothetical protein FJX45_08025 [Alphaproteobacteria bacterium]|nr:hypothetical protein [Alphaproteobacteria bacterium]MBM3652007.1 hypothetical protein [Alphaproteobacteria bacterium]